MLNKTIFFTINGTYLGEAFKDVDLGLNADEDQRVEGGHGKASKLIAAIREQNSQ